MLLDDRLLDLARQVVPHLVGPERGVEQERRAGAGEVEHVVLVEELGLVAGDEVGLPDQVRGADRARPEAQVRDRDRARLLRVVDEVPLAEVVRLLGDDLDRVLVGADGAVGAEAEEHGALDVVGLDVELGVDRQRGVRHVVHDADREVVLGLVLGGFVVDRLDHRRGELLRRQTVASRDHPRRLDERRLAGVGRLAQRGDDVEVERVADRARLLAAVEHRDRPHGLRQGGDELGDRERPVQPHAQHADLLARLERPLDVLGGGVAARAHDDDDALGLGVAEVVEQVVVTAGQRGELVHLLLHDARAGGVERVARLARLEERVGVLRGAAQHRLVRREGAAAVGGDEAVVDQLAQVVVGQLLDLRHLVRGAEAVEEVQERDAGAQRGGLADAGEVVRLLDRARGEQREPGLPARHHVGVVAEDRERVRRERARRDVHAVRGQLARDLVHVGDEQEQPLRRGERGRQRPGLERAVHGAGGAALGLHLRHLRHRAPDVLLSLRRPLVGPLAHVRRGGDRVDGNHLVGAVGDRSGRLVPVEGDHTSLGHDVPP